MFATFVLERDPLTLAEFPIAVQAWIKTVGIDTAAALAIWFLAFLLRAVFERRLPCRDWSLPGRTLGVLIGGIVVACLPTGLALLWNYLGWNEPSYGQGPDRIAQPDSLKEMLRPPLFGAGYFLACFALFTVLLPVLLNLVRLRWRRIWALAKLSFLDAVRNKVLWAFSFLLLLFLFGAWFLDSKEEDQVRNYVRAVFWVMTPLLLAVAALLAAFSIPTDIKRQTIHTIVTKPVERFEIVLGRFLGFGLLMTMVLVVMCLPSMIYVKRSINPEAAEESYKARVPVYGSLKVLGIKDNKEVEAGINVGYEWEYRKYITGATAERVVWTFPRLPANLGDRDTVRCEFTFDVFRTTKGEENRGVYCSFLFQNWKCDEDNTKLYAPAKLNEYRQARDRLQPNPADLAKAQDQMWSEEKKQAVFSNELAEKYGMYQLLDKEVVDFHTLSVDLPAGLFKNLAEWEQLKGRKPPPLMVQVQCTSATQYLGIAKYDLYLLAEDQRPLEFEMNFFKAAVGLLFRILLVIGVALTCGTYLSGVISFLATAALYLVGLVLPFAVTLAHGQIQGGGPTEALYRLVRHEHPAMPLEKTAFVNLAQVLDQGWQGFFGFVLSLFPDVDRYDFTSYVEEGFNISTLHLLAPTTLLLVGYLLPWAVLAYYLIRSREVAS